MLFFPQNVPWDKISILLLIKKFSKKSFFPKITIKILSNNLFKLNLFETSSVSKISIFLKFYLLLYFLLSVIIDIPTFFMSFLKKDKIFEKNKPPII